MSAYDTSRLCTLSYKNLKVKQSLVKTSKQKKTQERSLVDQGSVYLANWCVIRLQPQLRSETRSSAAALAHHHLKKWISAALAMIIATSDFLAGPGALIKLVLLTWAPFQTCFSPRAFPRNPKLVHAASTTHYCRQNCHPLKILNPKILIPQYTQEK